MRIEIESGTFLDFVALNEPAAALAYVTECIKSQEAEAEKFAKEKVGKSEIY